MGVNISSFALPHPSPPLFLYPWTALVSVLWLSVLCVMDISTLMALLLCPCPLTLSSSHSSPQAACFSSLVAAHVYSGVMSVVFMVQVLVQPLHRVLQSACTCAFSLDSAQQSTFLGKLAVLGGATRRCS